MSTPSQIEKTAIPDDVLAVCRRLHAAGHQAHLVGGGIRDLLLGRTPNDFDVATDALPDAVMQLFGQRYAIPTGLQHGTVTVLAGTASPHRHVEVTTFRGEGEYLDGRRPSSVHFSATLPEDLSRRDFTMNAIAYDPLADVLTDPFDGKGDLARRIVRAVGDPEQRFREDGLRPMRAVRQATQLAFTIEDATRAAIAATLDSFRKVSAERVRDELLKLLAAERPSTGVALMRTTGLLAEVLPELLATVGQPRPGSPHTDAFAHALAVLDETPAEPLWRLTALLLGSDPASARAIGTRLRLSIAQRELVVALVEHRNFEYRPACSDGALRRFVNHVGQSRIEPLLTLREAEVAARGQAREGETAALRARIDALVQQGTLLTMKDLAIDGREVMRVLARPPGPLVGRVLAALFERVLDDPSQNRPDILRGLVPEVAATLAGGDAPT